MKEYQKRQRHKCRRPPSPFHMKHILSWLDFPSQPVSNTPFARWPIMYVFFMCLGTWGWEVHTKLLGLLVGLRTLMRLIGWCIRRRRPFLVIAAAFSSWTRISRIMSSCLSKRRSNDTARDLNPSFICNNASSWNRQVGRGYRCWWWKYESRGKGSQQWSLANTSPTTWFSA